jgi:hypothetical protein
MVSEMRGELLQNGCWGMKWNVRGEGKMVVVLRRDVGYKRRRINRSLGGDRACVDDLRWDMGGDDCWGVMSNAREGVSRSLVQVFLRHDRACVGDSYWDANGNFKRSLDHDAE